MSAPVVFVVSGLVIGLPPVLVFGNNALRAKVVPEVLKGEKRICLAISEPHAGSDGTIYCCDHTISYALTCHMQLLTSPPLLPSRLAASITLSMAPKSGSPMVTAARVMLVIGLTSSTCRHIL